MTVKRQISWNQELNPNDNTTMDWQEIYTAPYQASRETKLQSFTFRLAHRLIPCGRFLKKMKIQNSDECMVCAEEDSIIHYLWECTMIQQFWQKVVQWFDDFTHISLLDINKAQFFFGVPKTRQNWRIINSILLVGKFFIQRQKLFHNGDLHLIHFLTHLRTKLITEKKVCAMERRMDKFRKWQHLLNVLSAE